MRSFKYKIYDGYAKKRAALIICFLLCLFLFLCFCVAANIPICEQTKKVMIICFSGILIIYMICLIDYLFRVKCPICNNVCKPSFIGYKIERRVVCEKCKIIWGLDYGGISDGENSSGNGPDGCDGEG